MDPMVKIHRGYAPVMPSYRGKLGAGDVAAMIELIKSLRDVHLEPGAQAPLPVEPAGRDAGARLPIPTPAPAPDQEGRGLRRLPPRPEPPGGEIQREDGEREDTTP